MNWLLFFLFFPVSLGANPARRIVVHKDEVIAVKTALGIATIIQVPDQPSSVVLGDSAAFKVEYLNQAITIKPLHGGATSNLYIHTEYDRYSVKLVTGMQASADYVVYLTPFQPPKPKSEALEVGLPWKIVGSRRDSEFGSITLSRIAKTKTSILLELEIVPNRNGRIDPGLFWLLQGKANKPIENLLISSLESKKGQSITATLVLRKSDLKSGAPGQIDVRLKDPVSFSLTKEMLWKN